MAESSADAILGLAYAIGKLGDAVHEEAVAIQENMASLRALLQTPYMRRMAREEELGYRLPDFVWQVEEKMRRTEGSGNGRIIRG